MAQINVSTCSLTDFIKYIKQPDLRESDYDAVMKSINEKYIEICRELNTINEKRIDLCTKLREAQNEYKKAIGNKLHFFNKETSISLYLTQGKNIISLVP